MRFSPSSMADLSLLCSVMPQVEPCVAVHPADLDDGKKFLAGAITRQREISKLPPMCLRYGHILAGNQPPPADSEIQDLYCSPEVEGEVLGGQENEHGERIFEIYFSQDNRDYLVRLAFGPLKRLFDEDSQQEDEELESDLYSDNGEETYEDYENDYDEETFEDEHSDNDAELSDNRVCELYFPGDRYYVVRLVFEKEEEDDRFLEEGDEFLFEKLQRAAGISHGGDEEIPTIENKSFCDLPEIVSENSKKLTELKIEERGDNTIEYPETAKGIKNGIGEDQSSDTFLDPLMILEQQNHLVARVVCDHLQLRSSA